MKQTLISLALAGVAIAAYAVAAIVFILHLLLVFPPDSHVALTPYAILTGWIFNAGGTVVAIAGLFTQKQRRWACIIPLGLNAAPPLIVLGLMAVGFVLIG